MKPEEYNGEISWSDSIANSPSRFKPGQKIGKVTVVKLLGFDRRGSKSKLKILYDCVCDCGNRTLKTEDSLRSVVSGRRSTISCGCVRTNNVIMAAKDPNRPTYRKNRYDKNDPAMIHYRGIRSRIYTTSNKKYPIYGGRGITICPEWDDLDNGGPDNFCDWMYNIAGFTKDMPSGSVSIDRIDNDGPYSPENCHLSLNKGQSNNKTSQNVIYNWYNHKYTQTELAWQFGKSPDRVGERVREFGMSIHEAVRAPKFKSSTERQKIIAQNGNGLAVTPKAFVFVPFKFVDHSEVDARSHWRPNNVPQLQTCPSEKSYEQTLNTISEKIRLQEKENGNPVKPFQFTNSGSTDFLLSANIDANNYKFNI